MKFNFGTAEESSSPIDLDEILCLDKSIRFVGICSMQGKLLDIRYNPKINPLISDKELLYSIIKSVEKIRQSKEYEKNLGPPLYSVTAFANVKRATILTEEDIVFVSFERYGNEYQILNLILEQLNQRISDFI